MGYMFKSWEPLAAATCHRGSYDEFQVEDYDSGLEFLLRLQPKCTALLLRHHTARLVAGCAPTTERSE